MVRPLISTWNLRFFSRRAVQFRLGKVSRPRRRRSSSRGSRGSRGRYDDDDSQSESESESDLSDDDEYGDPRYRRSSAHKQKSRRRGGREEERVYELTVEYVPPQQAGPVRRGTGFPGFP